MHVPFVDLQAQYQSIRSEIDQAIDDVIAQTAFIKGPFVDKFESEFADACQAKHCIGVANGTDAIFIALKMLGVGSGDEVITSACSWIATSEMISLTGAAPVFVDIDQDYLIDANKIEQAITPRTRAIVPVHLYGQPAQLDVIREICDRHNLYLVEDCAQAHLATFQGRSVGSSADAATFSFFPGKNLGAYGDAGAIITNNDALAERMRMFANHGALQKHTHRIEGINSRLDGLQASILSVKLPHLKHWTQKRHHHALKYHELLPDVPQVQLPNIPEHRVHAFHLFVVRVERREQLQTFLKECGIATAIHYPTPLPFLDAYARLGHQPSDFPRATEYASKILSLPMFPELTNEQIQHVANSVREFYGQR